MGITWNVIFYLVLSTYNHITYGSDINRELQGTIITPYVNKDKVCLSTEKYNLDVDSRMWFCITTMPYIYHINHRNISLFCLIDFNQLTMVAPTFLRLLRLFFLSFYCHNKQCFSQLIQTEVVISMGMNLCERLQINYKIHY